MFRKRFSTTTYVAWTNELLEELSGKGYMPTLKVERGALISNKKWLSIPDGCRRINKIYNPQNRDQEYNFAEVEQKIKLIGTEFDPQTGTLAMTSFSDYAVGSVTTQDITSADEGAYDNFLLEVTGGTREGETVILSGNDEADGTECKLEFLHDLVTAFNSTTLTAASIYAPANYLMIEFAKSYTVLTASTEEVPVDDDYERRITRAWLRYCAERDSSETPQEADGYLKDFYRVLGTIQEERLSTVNGVVKGRRMCSFRNSSSVERPVSSYEHKD